MGQIQGEDFRHRESRNTATAGLEEHGELTIRHCQHDDVRTAMRQFMSRVGKQRVDDRAVVQNGVTGLLLDAATD